MAAKRPSLALELWIAVCCLCLAGSALAESPSAEEAHPGTTEAAAKPAPWAQPEDPLGTCIHGDDGEILYAPPGHSCGHTREIAFRPIAEFLPQTAATDGPWVRVEPGEERLYQLTETVERVGSDEVASKRSGLRYDFVVSGEAGTEIHSILRFPPVEGEEGEQISRALRVVRPQAEAFQLLSKRFQWLGETRDVRLNPVPHYLPTLRQGATWNAGEYEVDGVFFRERGQILGLQEARTPAGDFPGALVVQHVGSISGQSVLAPGKYVAIEGGRVERRTWIARGLGPVMMNETFEFTVQEPGKPPVQKRIVTRLALRGIAATEVPADAVDDPVDGGPEHP